jgi:hypothetical protein
MTEFMYVLQGINILLVEANEFNILQQFLQNWGAELDKHNNEALQFLRIINIS